MPENRDYITSTDDSGSISISEDVLSAIAALAVAEVGDRVALAGVVPGEGELPDRKNLAKALRVTTGAGGGVNVDLSIRVRYGEKLPALAASLQNAVGQALESQAGVSVDSVNIRVVALDFSAQVTQ